MTRNASAVWQGGLKDGKGSITTASGVLSSTQYSFATRFENGIGTNPEELNCGGSRRLLFHGAFGSVRSPRGSTRKAFKPPRP